MPPSAFPHSCPLMCYPGIWVPWLKSSTGANGLYEPLRWGGLSFSLLDIFESVLEKGKKWIHNNHCLCTGTLWMVQAAIACSSIRWVLLISTHPQGKQQSRVNQSHEQGASHILPTPRVLSHNVPVYTHGIWELPVQTRFSIVREDSLKYLHNHCQLSSGVSEILTS